jgi:hypothetical protein
MKGCGRNLGYEFPQISESRRGLDSVTRRKMRGKLRQRRQIKDGNSQ